jgi:hypothetical protein
MGNQRYIAAFDIQKNESTYELVSIEDFNIKNISFPLYAMDDSTLVSYIDNYIYEIMKDKDLLDSAATEHLSNDGVVLCLYKIK